MNKQQKFMGVGCKGALSWARGRNLKTPLTAPNSEAPLLF